MTSGAAVEWLDTRALARRSKREPA